MRCTCDKSTLFPRCIKNPDYCIKLDKDQLAAIESISRESEI